MSECILTVTIPSYNVEKYLAKCVESMLMPEVLEDIELLVVNDGSSDGTEQMALEYQRKYPGTLRVINKKNGGHGSAVNTGIKNATGKYFKVIDADDWVDSEIFVKFVEKLKTLESDVVATRFLWVDDSSGETKEELSFSPFQNVTFDKEQEFASACEKPYIKMHSMTIKTYILQDNDIRLDEKCFYVDAEYVLFPVPYVKTVTYLDMYLYMYRVGTLHQSMNIKSMQKNVQHHEKVLEHLLKFYKEQIDKQSDAVKEKDYEYKVGCGKDKTRCGNDKTRCGNDKTRCGNDKTGCGNDKTGCGKDITGCGNDKTGCGKDITGCGNDKTRCGKDKTGCGNDKTGCGNDKTGCGNDKTGCNNDNFQNSIDYMKLRYLECGIARFYVSQIKIYLSFPPSNDWKRKIVLLDRQLKADYPDIYRSVANKSVKLLRATHFILYRIASGVLGKMN